jgi:hypothetical protein
MTYPLGTKKLFVFKEGSSVKRKRLLISMITGILILLLGGLYYNQQIEQKRVSTTTLQEVGNPTIPLNKLGETLTLSDFKKRLNQVSSLEIGHTKILKKDQLTTSFMYTFNQDLALSGVYQNHLELLYKIILIGLNNEEFNQFAENIIQVSDSNLSSLDCQEILLRLEPGKNTTKDDVYSVKNGIIYQMRVLGNYLYFSATKDE